MGSIFKILCSNSKFSLYGAPVLDLNLLMHNIHISLYFVTCLQLINNLKFGSCIFYASSLIEWNFWETHAVSQTPLAFPLDFWIMREYINIKTLFSKTNSLLKLWTVGVEQLQGGVCSCAHVRECLKKRHGCSQRHRWQQSCSVFFGPT